MANHFSALKRARQTEKRTAVNRSNKTLLRSSLRKLDPTTDLLQTRRGLGYVLEL